MKTVIGLIPSGQNEIICNIASEFFGEASKPKKKKDKFLWLTFPSQKAAREFSTITQFNCVDVNQEAFK